jgi:hypothetical protein
VHIALYAGVMLVLLGLPALGARIATRARRLGLPGMALLLLGLAFEAPLHSVIEFAVPPLGPFGPELLYVSLAALSWALGVRGENAEV